MLLFSIIYCIVLMNYSPAHPLLPYAYNALYMHIQREVAALYGTLWQVRHNRAQASEHRQLAGLFAPH